MASEDEVGESTCAHDLPVYWDDRNEWGDCGICYPIVARWRAWQAFTQWCDGTAEQWQAVADQAWQDGYTDGLGEPR